MGVLQNIHFKSGNAFSIGHASRRFGFIATILLTGLLAACGSGGGSGTAATKADPVSGYVVKGPTAGATVNLFSVRADGTKTLLATTTTDASGFYRFGTTPARDMVLLVEASEGDYLDEITAVRMRLVGTLRAVAVGSGSPLRMSVSPFSEVLVHDIESASTQNWGPSNVNSVSTAFSDTVGVSDILALKPVDMRNLSDIQASSDDDFFLSVMLGGYTGMLHRMGSPSNPVSQSQGVAALRTVIKEDFDEQYTPAFLQGLVDFLDVTAIPADIKRQFKGEFLLNNGYASDAQIAAAMPTGQATGATIAPMPNNSFDLVPEPNIAASPGIGTIFDSRGALVVLGDPHADNYRYLYSGSAGEVYGDGEIGIGRWHGGVVFNVTNGTSQSPIFSPEILSAENGVPYALAVPATNSPTCGKRILPLVGQTHPIQTAGPGFKPMTGFTPDSAIAIQYFGSTAYVGYDIGLQFSNGTTYRVMTVGGTTDPWASGIRTAADNSFELFFYPPNPPADLAGLYWNSNGMLAGVGGRKASLMIRVETPGADAETLAAAFSGPATLDASGCATGNAGDGSTINPPFADDTYWVFASADSGNTTFRGAPVSATFGANGSLLSAAGALNISGNAATYDLAGNSYAFIGRVKGPFTFGGTNYDQSLPFAVAKPAGTLPTTGTRHYHLVSSSAAIATVGLGSAIAELPPGQISSATLDINFGEWPAGTPSNYYGSVSVLIEGIVAGEQFTLSVPFTGTTSDSIYYRDSGTLGQGAVTGPNSEFVVLRYMTTIGGASVQGVLLLQSQ